MQGVIPRATGSRPFHVRDARVRQQWVVTALALLVLAASATLFAAMPISASAVGATTPLVPFVGATAVVAPGSGYVDTEVTESGSGYAASTNLNLTFNSTAIPTCISGSIVTDPDGTFTCEFAVPELRAGVYDVNATDGMGDNGTTTFTVLAPTLAVSPTHGYVASVVWANGSGYNFSSAVTLTFGSTPVSACSEGGSLVANATGNLSCAFLVPLLKAGTYPLYANDSNNSASTSYAIDAPTLDLVPLSGDVGTGVTASGSGYSPSTSITLTFGTNSITGCPTTAPASNASGEFSCSFAVPVVISGVQTVTAGDGINTASATYTVDGPSLSLSPTMGNVGISVTASGGGYAPSTLLTLSFSSTNIPPSSCTTGSLTTGTGGTFSCSFAVPSSVAGVHTVSATDGTNLATASFTVTTRFSLSVGEGVVGTVVTLSGSGFAGSTTYTYCLQPTAVSCSTGSTFVSGANGNIPANTDLTIPAEPAGPYYVDVSLSTTLVASAPFTVTPASLTIVPTSGPVGTVVTLTGSGFAADGVYLYCFQSTQTVCSVGAATFTADPSGNIPAGTTVTVPAAPDGAYYVDVSQAASLFAAGAYDLTPALSLAPVAGTVGSSGVATGTGLDASTAYNLVWNSAITVCSGTTTAVGGAVCSFLVPTSAAGPATLTLSEGSNAPTATFTVIPELTATPTSGPVGSSIDLVGTGFLAQTGFTVTWNTATTLCTGTTGAQGGLSCTPTVPNSPVGTVTITATAGSSSASATFDVSAYLMLSVTAGTVGTVGTATGSGFDSDAPYTLNWNSTTTLCSGSTSGAGAFSCPYTIPSSPAGIHTITATEGPNSASALFTLGPSLVLSDTTGFVGSSEIVTGMGFDALTAFSLSWDSSQNLCSGTTDSNGSFGCTFLIPSSTAGTHRIVATEGTYSPSAVYTVSSNLALTPTQGPAGTSVSAVGTGFGPSSPYTIVWNGAGALCSGTTNPLGGFLCTFTFPSEPGGFGTVTATQGSNQASTSFQVIPTLTLSATTGTVGSTESISGNGLAGSAAYSVNWNGSTTLCSGTTNASGGFSCPYTIPSAPAGLHTISVVQSGSSFGAAFSVIPSLTGSPLNGTVGTSVTLVGAGFNANARYVVTWNSSTTLCSGTTSSIGAFTCTFVVPAAVAGTTTITTSEGQYAPTFSFTVAQSPPGPSEFPWWIVVVVVIVIGILLVGLLVYEQRRHHGGRSGRPRPHHAPTVQAWNATPPAPLIESAVPSPSISATPVEPTSAAVGAIAATPETDPEDIDALIARLERMSVEMFKRTPKQLGEQRTAGESEEAKSQR